MRRTRLAFSEARLSDRLVSVARGCTRLRLLFGTPPPHPAPPSQRTSRRGQTTACVPRRCRRCCSRCSSRCSRVAPLLCPPPGPATSSAWTAASAAPGSAACSAAAASACPGARPCRTSATPADPGPRTAPSSPSTPPSCTRTAPSSTCPPSTCTCARAPTGSAATGRTPSASRRPNTSSMPCERRRNGIRTIAPSRHRLFKLYSLLPIYLPRV
ncbi:hypothetical protein FOCC_FOCC001614 [Frankliniella occidentalis]|nr:hypothetical protein FOCC_FOCC001614 [Frankliniella occidentalis]